jgi:hypothetical protein
MAFGTIGGLGGQRPQPQEQDAGLFGTGFTGIGDLLGMGGEDPRSAMKRQMFMNGFRTQIGSIPQFGEGVQQAMAQGFQMKRANEQDAIAAEDREREMEVRRQTGEVMKEFLPANLHGLAVSDPKSALELYKMMQPSAPTYGWEVINGQLVRTDSAGGVTPMGQFGNQPRPMTAEERAAWGIPADDTTPYYFGDDGTPKALGGGGITINTGENSGAFGKKGDEMAAARLDGVISAGQGAQQFMGDINTLAALGSQINTGKGAEILNTLGPYAQALGVDIGGLGEAQAYQAIIDRMAPAMRPAGSGASSDFDARQFLSSLPQLGNTPQGNQIITQTLTALQQHKIAAAEIASLAFLPQEQGGISWQEAERRIRELPDPYTGFNEYRKTAGGGAGSSGGGYTILGVE